MTICHIFHYYTTIKIVALRSPAPLSNSYAYLVIIKRFKFLSEIVMRVFMLLYIFVIVAFAERFETGCEWLFVNDAVWLRDEVVFFGKCDHKAWIGRYSTKDGKAVETKSFLRPKCESAEFKRAARLADGRIVAVGVEICDQEGFVRISGTEPIVEEICDKNGIAVMAFFDKNGVTWRRWQKKGWSGFYDIKPVGKKLYIGGQLDGAAIIMELKDKEEKLYKFKKGTMCEALNIDTDKIVCVGRKENVFLDPESPGKFWIGGVNRGELWEYTFPTYGGYLLAVTKYKKSYVAIGAIQRRDVFDVLPLAVKWRDRADKDEMWLSTPAKREHGAGTDIAVWRDKIYLSGWIGDFHGVVWRYEDGAFKKIVVKDREEILKRLLIGPDGQLYALGTSRCGDKKCVLLEKVADE